MRGPGLSVSIGGFLLVVSSVLQGGVQAPTPEPSPPPPAAAAAFDVNDCAACHEKAGPAHGDHAARRRPPEPAPRATATSRRT